MPLSEASVAANTQAERSPGDWLIGTGMVLSFMLYYLLGNTNLPFGILNDPHVVPASLLPFLGLPFLLIFLILAWMRLPLALALFPLTLPYFQAQYPKTVYKSLHFSLAEIAIFALLVLALGQLVLKKEVRAYFSWQALRERLGPFLLPAAIFLLAACVSVVIAYSRSNAQVALRKEVLLPLLYVVLVLGYIRTPRQVTNLLKGLIGAGLMIGLFGVIQYFFMKNTLTQEAGGVRIHTVYGNANNIGLFIDYGLPIALAWLVALKLSWRQRLLVLVLCLPMLISIFLTQSLGAWLALGAALLFIGALSLPNRKVLLIATVVLLVVAGAVLALYHDRILSYVFERHAGHGVGTAEKRIYLWQTAWHMIQDHPWFGVGLDNWLCHYSPNKVCRTSLPHYWITNDPVTGAWTGMSDEPTLSHPHNIFLHVWVSIGIFGLLAFIGVLILFFWTFSRILLRLRTAPLAERTAYRWLVVGVGASMVAALVQGQIDSAFLEQDLAYCFWLLCAALLILRQLTQTSWWREKAR
ncbi:O-antigen ligase family protein [Ktedonobacter racemifer]|uniref:O-antigen ligase family protein n=1 Tax=Ktedonobacter racemifer TaxID=363277 RepID=UPI0002DF4FD0|nr:O-antigen ligase family protein [Ktedonobacter racemifer]